jgi:hypothetical protein
MSSWASGDWSDGGLDDDAATSGGALSPLTVTSNGDNDTTTPSQPQPPLPPPTLSAAPPTVPPRRHATAVTSKKSASSSSNVFVSHSSSARFSVGSNSAAPPAPQSQPPNPVPVAAPAPTMAATTARTSAPTRTAAPSSWGTSLYGAKLRGLSTLAEPSPEDLSRLWESTIQEQFVSIQPEEYKRVESPWKHKRHSTTSVKSSDSSKSKDSVGIDGHSSKSKSRAKQMMVSPSRSVKIPSSRQRATSQGQPLPPSAMTVPSPKLENDLDGVETKSDDAYLTSSISIETSSQEAPMLVSTDALLDLFDKCTLYFLVAAVDSSEVLDRAAMPERLHSSRSDRVILSNKSSIAVCEIKTMIKAFISHFSPDPDHLHASRTLDAVDTNTLAEGDVEVKTDIAYPASEIDEDSDNASLQTSVSDRSGGLAFREEMSGMTIHPRMDLLAALAVYSVTITKKSFISNWKRTCSFVAWKRALHADELALPPNQMFLELSDRELERIWHKSTTRSGCDQISGIEADDLIRWALFRSFTDRAKVFKSLRGIQDSGRLYTISLDMLERFQMERWCRLHSYWTHMELLDVIVALVEFPEVHRRCGLNIREVCETLIGPSCSTIAFIICDYLEFADMVSTAASPYPSHAISNTLSKERFVRNFSTFLKDCVLS